LPLIEKKASSTTLITELSLANGRRLFEEHIGRPRVGGGVKDSTMRRYVVVFDRFLAWALTNGIVGFHQLSADLLNCYSCHLKKTGYSQKTVLHELTTLQQCVRWLINAGHLVGYESINLKPRNSGCD
jgi:site-specific recombinase XerC